MPSDETVKALREAAVRDPLNLPLIFYSAVFMDDFDAKSGETEEKHEILKYPMDQALEFISNHATGGVSENAKAHIRLLANNFIFARDELRRPLPIIHKANGSYSYIKDYIINYFGKKPREFVSDINTIFSSDINQRQSFILRILDLWRSMESDDSKLKLKEFVPHETYILTYSESSQTPSWSILIQITTELDEKSTRQAINNAYSLSLSEGVRSISNNLVPKIRLVCAPRFGFQTHSYSLDRYIGAILWDAPNLWEMVHQIPKSKAQRQQLIKDLPTFFGDATGRFGFEDAWESVKIKPNLA